MTPRFEFTADALSLDFINTVRSRLNDEPVDLLDDYGSLLGFGRAAGLLDAMGYQRLRESAARHPDEAARVYQRAMALRESLHRIMNAVIQDREPDTADTRLLQEAARDTFAHGELQKTEHGYEWTWTSSSDLAGVLWPIAASALGYPESRTGQPHPAVRQRPLRLARSRPQLQPQPPLVRDVRLRSRAKASRYRERRPAG